MTENEEPYLQRPHVWETWEKLYWGLVGHTEEHPDREGELANLSPMEVYNYVAASLSTLLNRPAPLDEIASAIFNVWLATLDSYNAICSVEGEAAGDEDLSILLRLEEAWLMIETELGPSMPPEFRFSDAHRRSGRK